MVSAWAVYWYFGVSTGILTFIQRSIWGCAEDVWNEGRKAHPSSFLVVKSKRSFSCWKRPSRSIVSDNKWQKGFIKGGGGMGGRCAHLQVIEAEWREWGCECIWSPVDRKKVNLWNEQPKWWPRGWLGLILSRFGCYPMCLESWLNFFWRHPWEFSRKV